VRRMCQREQQRAIGGAECHRATGK
jgi:hypothetical protein